MKVPFLQSRNFTFLLLFSVVLTVPPVVRANNSAQPRSTSGTEQDSDIDLVASRLLEKLKRTEIKTIAVRPFYGDTLNDRSLGYKLSESITSALAKYAGDIHIVDQARMIEALEQQKWMAIDLDDPEVFRSIAVTSGVDTVVHGTFKSNGKVIELLLKVVDLSTKKKIHELKASIPVPQGTDVLNAPVRDPVTGVYLTGSGGVTVPGCKYCPEPDFSSEARQKKIQRAQDVFRITVGPDGRIAELRLLKPAGYGLDENSAAAVKRWQLSPARLPDGTAVPSRINIEVTYDHK